MSNFEGVRKLLATAAGCKRASLSLTPAAWKDKYLHLKRVRVTVSQCECKWSDGPSHLWDWFVQLVRCTWTWTSGAGRGWGDFSDRLRPEDAGESFRFGAGLRASSGGSTHPLYRKLTLGCRDNRRFLQRKIWASRFRSPFFFLSLCCLFWASRNAIVFPRNYLLGFSFIAHCTVFILGTWFFGISLVMMQTQPSQAECESKLITGCSSFTLKTQTWKELYW